MKSAISAFEWLDSDTILFTSSITRTAVYSVTEDGTPADFLPIQEFSPLTDFTTLLDIDVFRSADGQPEIVVLAQNDANGFTLMRLDIAGQTTKSWELPPVLIEVFQIGWSPDGGEIAFTASSDTVWSDGQGHEQACDLGCLFLLNVDNGEIALMQTTGNGVREFWWGQP